MSGSTLRAINSHSGSNNQSITAVGDRLHMFPGWSVRSALPPRLEDCGLIIATYQRPLEIVTLIARLITLPDCPAEVVIVDGSSGNESEIALRRRFCPLQLPFDLIYVRSSAGLTKQRNVGIDVSTKQFIYFLDDDCLPAAGYFSHLRNVFVLPGNERVGAVCGLVTNEMSNPLARRWRLRLALRLVRRGEPGTYQPSGTCIPRNPVTLFNGTKPVDTLHGCSMAFRRAVLNEYRFSEFFYGYSQGEDLEISLRIRRDWKLLWCGDAHVEHHHAEGGRPPSFSKGKMELRNRYFIWKRHTQNPGVIDRARFWLDMIFLVVADLLNFISAPFSIHPVSHAGGIIFAALECIFSPPSHNEPPAHKQYGVRVDVSRIEKNVS
jgi:GT2 family glycosyltransferase